VLRRLTIILALATAALAQRPDIAPRPIVPIPYAVPTAAVAFAGGRFLTVWSHERPGQSDLVGAFSDAEGKRISPAAFLILPNAGSGSVPFPAVQMIGMDDGYALFWIDVSETRHLMEIDLEGAVRSHVTVPVPRSALSALYGERYAWNGTHFFTVVRRGLNTEGFEFTRDGRIVRTFTLERRFTDRAIVPANDGFLVFTASDITGVTLQRVTPNGLSEREYFLHPFGHRIAATDAGNGESLAVWVSRDAELYAARVGADLKPGTRHQLFAGAPVHPLHVMRTGNGFRVAAWIQGNPGELRVFELNTDGSLRSAAPSGGDMAIDPMLIPPFASSDRVMVTLTGSCHYQCGSPLRTLTIREGGAYEYETIALAPQRQSSPHAAAAGGQFLVSWIDSAAGSTALRGAVVHANGETKRTTHIANGVTAAGDRMSWNGGEIALVVSRKGDRLVGSRMTRNATPLDAEPFPIAKVVQAWPMQASVTWHGDRWIVAWIDDRNLYTAEIETTGRAGTPRRFNNPLRPPRPELHNEVEAVSVASNGRDLLLVWQNVMLPDCGPFPCFASHFSTYVTRLDEYGQARDVPADMRSFTPVSIASSGEEFLLVRGLSVRTIRTDHDMLFVGEPRSLLQYSGGSGMDVAWDGHEYVAAVQYGITERYVARFRLNGDGLQTAPPLFTRLNRQDSFDYEQAAVAAEHNLGMIIAVHESLPGADTAHVTVLRESDLGPLPPPPAAPVARVEPLDERILLLTWDPVPGADGYYVEFLGSSGDWHWFGALRADERSMRVGASSKHRVRAFNAGGISEPSEPLP
jgi:hypothetical protein